jgi:Uma2 family endonuclease
MQAQQIGESSLITVDEYLEGEQHTDIRHEYFDGRVFAMAGATVMHDLIAGNLYGSLRNHLKGSPCRPFIFNTKVRLQVLAKDLFYYPDVMVACEPLENPRLYREKAKLIIEVLSEDENKDLVEKYFAYQRITSLEEYVVVSQDPLKPEITIFRRAEGWEPGETHRDGAFTLRSVSLTLKVSEVYSDLAVP